MGAIVKLENLKVKDGENEYELCGDHESFLFKCFWCSVLTRKLNKRKRLELMLELKKDLNFNSFLLGVLYNQCLYWNVGSKKENKLK